MFLITLVGRICVDHLSYSHDRRVSCSSTDWFSEKKLLRWVSPWLRLKWLKLYNHWHGLLDNKVISSIRKLKTRILFNLGNYQPCLRNHEDIANNKWIKMLKFPVHWATFSSKRVYCFISSFTALRPGKRLKGNQIAVFPELDNGPP